jgi:hypothetical protein
MPVADRTQLIELMQQMHANLLALMPGAEDGPGATPAKVRTRVRAQAKPATRANTVAAKA